MGWKEYIKDVISPSDTSSSRKFVTLIIAAHFIVASFVVLFFAFYVVLWSPKGKTDVDLLNVLKMVLQYDFYIILSGLGFVTSSDLVRVWVARGIDGFNNSLSNNSDDKGKLDNNDDILNDKDDQDNTKVKISYD